VTEAFGDPVNGSSASRLAAIRSELQETQALLADRARMSRELVARSTALMSGLRDQLRDAREQLDHRTRRSEEINTQHKLTMSRGRLALRAAERSLGRARDGLTDLYELAPIPFLTLSRHATINAINEAGSLFLGTPKAYLLGRPFTMLLAASDRVRFRRRVGVLGRGHGTTRFELTLQLRTGRVPIEMAASATPEGSVHIALVDLRERLRLEAERSALAVKAEASRAASAAKDEFLAMLSHELRAPLTPVVVGVGVLERAFRDSNADVGELFALIHRNLRHEVRLIDDLLDVTALARGKLALVKRVVDLRGIVEDAVEQVAVDAKEKSVRVDVDVSAGPSHVDGDADRMVQVFANLLRNAVRFSPPRTRVSISARIEAARAVVRVRDAGPGVPPRDRERIFERFVQGSRGQPSGGLGLGLAIAREVVVAHGGEIEVLSPKKGRGAVFEVRLALAEPEAPASDAPAQLPSLDALPVGASRRILYVEDHPDTGLLVASFLREAGHQVKLASSVAGALAYDGDPIDLLVSDIGLPDGSGLDLMRRLRAKRPLAGIALSGYGTDEDVQRSREAGFQQHLVKPIDVPRLLRAIDEVAAPR
jgi:signal transduction histidine kinase